MLADKDVQATVAVKSLDAAKRFYEGALGLKRTGGNETGALMYKCGSSTLLVYESQFAGTNKATAATWTIDGDLDAEVRALKAKGIAFEHYEFPDVRHEGDVHVMGDMRAAWFKDPDGNILALVSGRTSDVRS